ncbi:hypothetical protein [Ktedonobacter robiniae]|uniref:SnoaL-like domain-containing protein n=1 Tax=Ktedonobacter robiniae TaxID=2778365 RepID=A0ABQ3UPG1_9CHLR|nr:hypothetical protein [Ktedonobacter robiniae]GHO54590.1 hypothetical protein KSB_30650 [Ktedonobacter robiniae]
MCDLLSGDTESLLSLFTHDVALSIDGGGKVKAARKSLYGAFKTTRFLLVVKHKAPEMFMYRLAHINGQPGIIKYQKDVPLLCNGL